MQRDWRSALDEWEQNIRSLLDEVTLLGELPLTEGDRDSIAAALRSGIVAEGAATFTRDLQRRWPVILSAYLVLEGILSYQKGAMWPQICERLGLPTANYPARWGRIFLRTIRGNGKPEFRDLITAEHAASYLAVILAHGGIPNSCLPDLFRCVPGRLGRRRAIPRAAELIDRWRNDPKALRFPDRPVRRFLCYGGKIAEDFLDRYLGLVGYVREHGTVPDHSQFGLPARVVDAYQQWLDTRKARRRVRHRSSTMGARPCTRRQPPPSSPAERREHAAVRRRASWCVAAPFLALDPSIGAVVLHLPQQRLPDDRATTELTWIIQDGDQEERIPLPLWRHNNLLLAEAKTYEIQYAKPAYRVRIVSENGFERHWDVPGVTDELPIIAFRDDRTRKACGLKSIPAGWVWLLFHRSITIDCLSETYVPLHGYWSDFSAHRVNLEGFQEISLKRDGIVLKSIPLQNLKHIVRFTEAPLFTAEDANGDIPIFAEPPTIGIPLEPRQEIHIQLGRCSLILRTIISGSKIYSTEPVKAIDLEYTTENDDGLARVVLASLLPSPPFGMFELQVRRTLGQGQRLRFAVIPGLRVEGNDKLILPSPNGHPRPTTIRLFCPASGKLVAEHNGLQIEREPVSDDQGNQLAAWRVDVGAALDTVALHYNGQSHTGDEVIIPLTIPVPRLSWSIEGLTTDATADEARTPQVSQERFTAAPDPTLTVTMPDEAGLVSLRVKLRYPGGTQEIPPERRGPRSPAGRWSFRLGICQDTVRAVDEQAELPVTLEVSYRGEVKTDRLEVLRIVCPARPTSEPPTAPCSPPASPRVSTAPPANPSFDQKPAALPPSSPPLASPLTVPRPPVVASPSPLSALQTASLTRPPQLRPRPNQERPTARLPRHDYSFRDGTVTDSSSRDKNFGKSFREAPEPKSLQCDQDGNLIIEVRGRRYAPVCKICKNSLDTAIYSSVEPGFIYFKKCQHRIPYSEAILGRLLS